MKRIVLLQDQKDDELQKKIRKRYSLFIFNNEILLAFYF